MVINYNDLEGASGNVWFFAAAESHFMCAEDE